MKSALIVEVSVLAHELFRNFRPIRKLDNVKTDNKLHGQAASSEFVAKWIAEPISSVRTVLHLESVQCSHVETTIVDLLPVSASTWQARCICSECARRG